LSSPRNEGALQDPVEEIREEGGKAIHVVRGVGREDDVRHLAETPVREFGHFDARVDDAGISIFGQVWDVPMADWRGMFKTI
jgi:NAD(P)-dependent dehydrogenase (short-subunit alcohol dehydrogenase family)